MDISLHNLDEAIAHDDYSAQRIFDRIRMLESDKAKDLQRGAPPLGTYIPNVTADSVSGLQLVRALIARGELSLNSPESCMVTADVFKAMSQAHAVVAACGGFGCLVAMEALENAMSKVRIDPGQSLSKKMSK